jgi:hypothetical protein
MTCSGPARPTLGAAPGVAPTGAVQRRWATRIRVDLSRGTWSAEQPLGGSESSASPCDALPSRGNRRRSRLSATDASPDSDPVIALAFLRDMQAALAEMDLEVHSGIEIGRVELYDGDVIGPAAFAVPASAAGQIIGSRNVADLAGASSGAVSLGRSTLRATGKGTELFAL